MRPIDPPKTTRLHEFCFGDDGQLISRVHDATVQPGRSPKDDVFWFSRTGSRACVARKHLDAPRYNKYYSLRDCPDEAGPALLEALRARRVILRTQLGYVEDAILSAESAARRDGKDGAMPENAYGNVICDVTALPGSYLLAPNSLMARTAKAMSEDDPRRFLNEQDDAADRALAAVVQAAATARNRLLPSETADRLTGILRRIDSGSDVYVSEIAALADAASVRQPDPLAASALRMLKDDLKAYVHARQLRGAVAKEIMKTRN